ncbi:MAG: hypothetical protein JWM32_2903 [Verrucomicrobia bacterium]|nr:hypothetical protein [Verrucomicrobiota bacterium]
MKTSLKLIALLIAAGYPCVALAQSAGLSIPSFSPETAVSVFATALIGVIMVGDYSRRARGFAVRKAAVIVAPAGAFRAQSSRSECLAA